MFSVSGETTSGETVVGTDPSIDTYDGGDGDFWIEANNYLDDAPENSGYNEKNGKFYPRGDGWVWEESCQNQRFAVVEASRARCRYEIDDNGVFVKKVKSSWLTLVLQVGSGSIDALERNYEAVPGGTRTTIDELSNEPIACLLPDSSFVGYYQLDFEVPHSYYVPYYSVVPADGEFGFHSDSIKYASFYASRIRKVSLAGSKGDFNNSLYMGKAGTTLSCNRAFKSSQLFQCSTR